MGASPGLGFVHTGAATSFVMDIADLYKAEYTIPLAFDLAARGLVQERDARTALRDRIAENRLLGTIVRDVKTLLTPEGIEAEDIDQDLNQLWDEETGAVPGGVNWSSEPLDDTVISLIDPGMVEQYLAVVGPEFDTPDDGAGRP